MYRNSFWWQNPLVFLNIMFFNKETNDIVVFYIYHFQDVSQQLSVADFYNGKKASKFLHSKSSSITFHEANPMEFTPF